MPRLRTVVNEFDKATTSAGENDEEESGVTDNRFVAVELLKKPVSFNAYCAAVPIDDATELAAALEFDFQQLIRQKRSKKTKQDGDEDSDEISHDDEFDATDTKEKNAGANPGEVKSKVRLTGLRKQVMQIEDVVRTIDTYVKNNPLKNRKKVINAVVLTFRQYLDRINASNGKLADKDYVRFAVALEFALKAHDPVEYAKVAHETLQAFVSMRDKKASLVLEVDFTGVTKQTADLVRYNDNGVNFPALSQALTKLRTTLNMDRLIRMIWAVDCYRLLQFFDATVEAIKRDVELCRDIKVSGLMKRQLPTLVKSKPGRSIPSLVNDHLVNLNLNPGRAHDEYAANQTRERLSEARNVGRAVSVIIKARGKDEAFENPGLIFAWLLGDKGTNRMHSSR
jgi:hypothetical protein